MFTPNYLQLQKHTMFFTYKIPFLAPDKNHFLSLIYSSGRAFRNHVLQQKILTDLMSGRQSTNKIISKVMQ